MYIASDLAMHSAAEHIIVHSVASIFDNYIKILQYSYNKEKSTNKKRNLKLASG